MSFSHSIFIFYFINWFSRSICSVSLAVTKGFAEEVQIHNKSYAMLVLLQPMTYDSVAGNNDGGTPGARVTRQVKLADAAKMSQTKVLQLYFQLYKNLVISSKNRGSNPLNSQGIKPVVHLFQERIVDFFFPEAG